MTVGQRFKKLIESRDLTVTKFSHLINQSEKSVYNYLADKSMPKFDIATAIMRAFPELNPDWLISGEGEMWRDMPETKDTATSERISLSNSQKLQYEEKIRDLERIIQSNERVIGNQQEMIEMLRGR